MNEEFDIAEIAIKSTLILNDIIDIMLDQDTYSDKCMVYDAIKQLMIENKIIQKVGE